MTSAKAPEGRVNRNNGRLTATCTRDTVIGLASRLVINQPDAVSNIAVPTFETRLAVHITVNARCPKGPHREDAGLVGAAAVARSAPTARPHCRDKLAGFVNESSPADSYRRPTPPASQGRERRGRLLH